MLNQLLNQPLKLLTPEDIRLIAGSNVREDGVTEFKGGLDEGIEREQTPWVKGKL